MTVKLHEDLCAFMVMSRRIHLRIRNILHKTCEENENTRSRFSKFLYFLYRTL